MKVNYGFKRVIEPKEVMPTCAWKLDSKRNIYDDEIRISIKRIHIEGTSFRQLSMESLLSEDLKKKIMDIVSLRGKLHNPITDTGGLLYGVVEKIGEDYPNVEGIEVGDEVFCNTSLTCVPLKITEILNIDMEFGQIEAKGYAIAYGNIPILKRKTTMPENLSLYVLNESSTILKVKNACDKRKSFLIIGNNVITNIVYGYTIRKTMGAGVRVICIIDEQESNRWEYGKLKKLFSDIFDDVFFVDILRPFDFLEKNQAFGEFDLTVNCADIPGCETISVLATKDRGAVLFSNLVNSNNIALYLTEAIGKEIEILGAEGYSGEYEDFDKEIISDLGAYFNAIDFSLKEVIEDDCFEERRERQSIAGEGFISESHSMRRVMEDVINVSKYDCNVMITGETGVGKERIANIIQKNSKRNIQPYVKINCASISPTLMESEFFGYEAGAFTGAKNTGKKGYFEIADKGMVFLDEVGELPLDMQAKLLRVIQEGEFFKVGGNKPVKTDVRIISATNRDLESMVDKKEFRSDLYYRLNVFPIKIPSLRERKGDISQLSKFFVKEYGSKFGIKKKIGKDAIEFLESMEWPGNIRELENMIQRLLINSKTEIIGTIDVMREVHGEIFGVNLGTKNKMSKTSEILDLEGTLANIEKEIIREALNKNISTRKTAKALNISQTQLVRKKKKYNL